MSPKQSRRRLTVDMGGNPSYIVPKVQDGTGRPINKQSTVEYERETKKESSYTRKRTKYGKMYVQHIQRTSHSATDPQGLLEESSGVSEESLRSPQVLVRNLIRHVL